MRTKLIMHFLLIAILCPSGSQGQWQVLENPLRRTLYSVCFIDSVQGWVVGDTGTIMHTSDGGATWALQDAGILDDIQSVFMLDERHGWAIAARYNIDSLWFGSILLRTSDGGAVWTNQPYRDKYFNAIVFLDSIDGWIGATGGLLLRTSDGGANWAPAPVDSSNWMGYPVLRMRFRSPSYGFAVGGHIDRAGVIWRTTNGGDRWTAYQAAGEPVRDFHFIDSLHLLAIGGDFENGPATVRSTDGGETWVQTYLSLLGEAHAMSFRTASEGWVVLGLLGQYMMTKDTGASWTTFLVPDSSSVLDVDFPDSLHGYMVGTNGIIMKYQPVISHAPVVSGSGNNPLSFVLKQNYPNPFNPLTSIQMTLPVRGHLRLVLFDVLAREVAVLADGRYEAGICTVDVDATHLPSGVYFYRMELRSEGSEFFSDTKKMVLLK